MRNVIATVALDKVVIWTTHIVSDIEFIARDILMLKSGQLIARGRLRSWWRVCRVRSLRSRCSLGRCPNGRTKLWWATYSGGKGDVLLRIVADECPGGLLAAPDLEDVYLYHFQEVSREGER